MPIPTIVLTHAGGPHLDAYLAGLAASSEVGEVSIADAGGSTFAAAQKALGPKLKATGKDAVALLREHKPKFALVTMEAVLAPAAIDAALEQGCHVHAEKPACVRASDFEPLVRKAEGKHLHLMLAFANRLRPEAREAQMQRATSDPSRGCFPYESSSAPPKSFVLLRGSAHSPGPEVFPAVPASLTPKQPGFPAPDEFTTRRRLTLANWIASPDNPLTARVIVNRVWQHHFGEGLVRTPSDFGLIGSAPTHPELLDWLADWFVKEGRWSLKKLHRLILASATWQQASKSESASVPAYEGKSPRTPPRSHAGTLTLSHSHADDPENLLLSHFPYRRLEVEAIRDSMLAVSGRLNPRVGGPSMYLEVPKEALAGSSDPDKIWKPFDETDASRRTVYAFLKRSFVVPLLEVLDVCDTTQSSDKRAVTSIAPQALTLFNGEFVNRQSRHFADRLRREAGPLPTDRIQLAWPLALSRPPKPEELTAMQRFLAEETANQLREATAASRSLSTDKATHAALTQLCRVVLNLNEFVYPD